MNWKSQIQMLMRSSARQNLWCAVLVCLTLLGTVAKAEAQQTIRYGITPYQDSALPVVAAMKGWYKEEGLNVELVPLAWGDVVTALSSGSIDVAIYNFNSFLAPYENAVLRTPKPVFFAPLFVFKGQAIMVHDKAGWKTIASLPGDLGPQRVQTIASISAQLKGKRVCVTRGTELEQIVLAAIVKGGLKESAVEIIHASPEDCLAAFLAKSIDAFAAGLTERIEAQRNGAVELLTTSDVMLPVIDGLITTDAFAAKHQAALDKLVQLWFKTIQYIAKDVPNNSKEIREYLRTTASTRYSPEEYAIAWTFDIFPDEAKDAYKLFSLESSPSYWKKSWDDIGDFLISQKKATGRAPYSAYLGDTTLGRLAGKK